MEGVDPCCINHISTGQDLTVDGLRLSLRYFRQWGLYIVID